SKGSAHGRAPRGAGAHRGLCPRASLLADGVPTSCCLSYHSRPVPRGLIASAYVTSSSCTQPGVIFVTKKKQEICADPQAPWVRAHLKHFQKKQN
uniref:C-C motif chemokine 3-like n=1 Tax=Nothoprocta perdicaria TaxID=30464 RepID=A0A8C7EEU1_NOTPE